MSPAFRQFKKISFDKENNNQKVDEMYPNSEDSNR